MKENRKQLVGPRVQLVWEIRKCEMPTRTGNRVRALDLRPPISALRSITVCQAVNERRTVKGYDTFATDPQTTISASH